MLGRRLSKPLSQKTIITILPKGGFFYAALSRLNQD